MGSKDKKVKDILEDMKEEMGAIENEIPTDETPSEGVKLELGDDSFPNVEDIVEEPEEHKIKLTLDTEPEAEEEAAEDFEPEVEPKPEVEEHTGDDIKLTLDSGIMDDPEPLNDFEEETIIEEEPVEEGLMGGGLNELGAIREAITNLSDTEQAFKETEKSLKAKKKELDVQRKRVEEKINSTIKKARSELEKGFDEEINVAEKAIKEAEAKKKEAKSAAVNERMKRENSYLVDENKVLTADVKSQFKEADVPAICRSRLYYALFDPKKTMDYVICIIGILIFAGLIPFIVTSFIHSGIMKALVWVIIVIFFAAIYFLISAWTKKGEKLEVIKNMRTNVDQIAANKKFIKDRNKNIKADPDESQYNLYEYDQQVEAARTDYEIARSEKEQAMQKFENEESVNIRTEMEEEKAPIFQELEKEIEQMTEDLQVRSEAYQEAARVMDEYNSEFGDKGIKADKIDELIEIIKDGKARTIREALDVQKNK